MIPVDENNTRHHLELLREKLVDQKNEFDRNFGVFSFALLTSIQSFALMAYFTIAWIAVKYRKPRPKTNWMVALWAVTNLLALLEKTSRSFASKVLSCQIGGAFPVLGEFSSALSRNYGTFLYIVWFVTRYCPSPKPKYNVPLYCLMIFPLFVCGSFIGYYFFIDEFVYEVYTPGSDIVNLLTYFIVTVLFIICQVADETRFSHNHYTFLISIINLVTNFPICLTTVYLRFVLDISWAYRFHIYLVDFFLDVIACSNAFIILFITILYNRRAKKDILGMTQKQLLEGM